MKLSPAKATVIVAGIASFAGVMLTMLVRQGPAQALRDLPLNLLVSAAAGAFVAALMVLGHDKRNASRRGVANAAHPGHQQALRLSSDPKWLIGALFVVSWSVGAAVVPFESYYQKEAGYEDDAAMNLYLDIGIHAVRSLMFGLAGTMFIALPLMAIRAWREGALNLTKEDVCPSCGYSLAGLNKVEKCPECGEVIDA